mgnify:CR=1 FL=1
MLCKSACCFFVHTIRSSITAEGNALPEEEKDAIVELPAVPDHELQGLGVFFDIEDETGKVCFIRGGSWTAEIIETSLILLVVWNVFWAPFFLNNTITGHSGCLLPKVTTVMMLDSLVGDLLYFVFGVVLRLRTSTFDERQGKEFGDLQTIFQMTVRSKSFWADVISLVPMMSALPVIALAEAYAEDLQPVSIISLLKFLRFWRLVPVLVPTGMVSLRSSNNSSGQTAVLKTIMSLAGLIMFFAHLLGSGWLVVIAISSPDSMARFVAHNDLDAAIVTECVSTFNMFTLYCTALKDGVGVVSATAIPASIDSVQRLYLALFQPLAAIIMAYVFAQLVLFANSAAILSTRQNEHLSFITAAMQSLGIPRGLRGRIFQYHRFMQLQHNPDMYDKLLCGLSYNLLVDIKLHLFRKLINNSPLLQDLRPDIIHQLVMNFQESIFSPGDIILREGDYGSEMFFIIKGQVDVLNDKLDLVATKRAGDYFGEVALFFKVRRTAWVRAKTFCVLAEMDKVAFDETLRYSPEQRMKMLNQISGFGNLANRRLSSSSSCDDDDNDGQFAPAPTLSKSQTGVGRLSVADTRHLALDNSTSMDIGPIQTRDSGLIQDILGVLEGSEQGSEDPNKGQPSHSSDGSRGPSPHLSDGPEDCVRDPVKKHSIKIPDVDGNIKSDVPAAPRISITSTAIEGQDITRAIESVVDEELSEVTSKMVTLQNKFALLSKHVKDLYRIEAIRRKEKL